MARVQRMPTGAGSKASSESKSMVSGLGLQHAWAGSVGSRPASKRPRLLFRTSDIHTKPPTHAMKASAWMGKLLEKSHSSFLVVPTANSRRTILRTDVRPSNVVCLPPYSQSTRFGDLFVVLFKHALCCINGHHKQSIKVDIISNYMVHFGLREHVFI